MGAAERRGEISSAFHIMSKKQSFDKLGTEEVRGLELGYTHERADRTLPVPLIHLMRDLGKQPLALKILGIANQSFAS